MKKEAFALLQEAEQSWWYKGRALAIRAMLARARVVTPLGSVLDFGAGFGGMYAELARLSPQVDAFEPEEGARTVAARQGYVTTYTTAGEALAKQYSLIGLFDVIEHIEDDTGFLLSLHTALTPDGLLAITVPAFQFLWSEHDVVHQHFRRYSKRALSELLARAGYEIVILSYWDTLLFLPAALTRLLGNSGSSALRLSGFVNALLLSMVTLESKILRFCSLPFGVSLVVIARRKHV
jgi:SAM-dependent methyltransferase